MTEAPTYIKQHSNGSFVLCPEPEASGIAFAGSVYHLLGREPLEGAESVMLEEVDAGTEITRANETNGIVFVTLAESGGSMLPRQRNTPTCLPSGPIPSSTRRDKSAGMAGRFISAFRNIPHRPTGRPTAPPACGRVHLTPPRSGPPGASLWGRTMPILLGPK